MQMRLITGIWMARRHGRNAVLSGKRARSERQSTEAAYCRILASLSSIDKPSYLHGHMDVLTHLVHQQDVIWLQQATEYDDHALPCARTIPASEFTSAMPIVDQPSARCHHLIRMRRTFQKTKITITAKQRIRFGIAIWVTGIIRQKTRAMLWAFHDVQSSLTIQPKPSSLIITRQK